jgi:hypothetical protein
MYYASLVDLLRCLATQLRIVEAYYAGSVYLLRCPATGAFIGKGMLSLAIYLRIYRYNTLMLYIQIVVYILRYRRDLL